MPTYNDTPLPTQTPAASQSLIRDNFNQISNSYGTDHVEFTGSTQGYHKKVSFNDVASPAAPANPQSILYTSNVGTPALPQLFFRNSAGAEQITGTSSVTANGYLVVGGIYIQWGGAVWPGNNNTINFPTPFPTACFVAMCQNANSGNNATYMNVTAVTQSTFRVFSPNIPSGSNLFFIAIGH